MLHKKNISTLLFCFTTLHAFSENQQNNALSVENKEQSFFVTKTKENIKPIVTGIVIGGTICAAVLFPDTSSEALKHIAGTGLDVGGVLLKGVSSTGNFTLDGVYLLGNISKKSVSAVANLTASSAFFVADISKKCALGIANTALVQKIWQSTLSTEDAWKKIQNTVLQTGTMGVLSGVGMGAVNAPVYVYKRFIADRSDQLMQEAVHTGNQLGTTIQVANTLKSTDSKAYKQNLKTIELASKNATEDFTNKALEALTATAQKRKELEKSLAKNQPSSNSASTTTNLTASKENASSSNASNTSKTEGNEENEEYDAFGIKIKNKKGKKTKSANETPGTPATKTTDPDLAEFFKKIDEEKKELPNLSTQEPASSTSNSPFVD